MVLKKALFLLAYFHLKTIALAQMGTASFCEVQRSKRYSGQLEIAPKNI